MREAAALCRGDGFTAIRPGKVVPVTHHAQFWSE
jgi:hypothetical protein